MNGDLSLVAVAIKSHIDSAVSGSQRLGRNADYYYGCQVKQTTAESIARSVGYSMDADDATAFLVACGVRP